MSENRARTVTAVALPAVTLWMLTGGVALAVVIMLAMLVVEIIILVRVYDLLDLIHRLVPPG